MFDPAKHEAIEDQIRQVRNRVYSAAVIPFERAERDGLIVGNGHHMAQEIAEAAVKLLRERYEKANGA